MMENNTIYQQKDISWIVNVIFYLATALLALVVVSYGIFYVKAKMQVTKIARIDEKIALYGTPEQKEHEAKVYDYKKKIDDFAVLIADHKMSSNVFSFLEAKTLPGVAFFSLTLSGPEGQARLAGEAQDMATLGKQFGLFEDSQEYIKNISVVNSQIAPSGNIAFVFNIDLEPEIFKYGAQFAK